MLVNLNNISFQGKFTTPMQGRNGILNDVTLAFERKTKGLKGSLELAKGKNSLLLKYNNNTVPFNIYDYGDLTGAHIEQKTTEAVENIAESFAKFFRILKAQASYEKVVKKLKRSKSKAESALSANMKSYKQALSSGNNKCDTLYQSIITKNNAKINKIDNITQSAAIRYVNFINNIAGDDARALQYIKSILDI